MFGRDEKVSQVRLTAVQYIVLGIFMILAYGLWRLQVVQSDMYASLAEKNRVRNVPILAPRGKILDREGRPSRRLFAIGPMSQAAFWEIVAVPDIRLQTAALSERIVAGLAPPDSMRSRARSSIRPKRSGVNGFSR